MSYSATITTDTGLASFGHLRRMLTSHWGCDIHEVYFAEPFRIEGQGYEVGIQFESQECAARVAGKIQVGRAYTQEEWRATFGKVYDAEMVDSLQVSIAGVGESFDRLCSFCRRYGYDLRERTTKELVDLDSPEQSLLYSLSQLESEIIP